VYVVTVVDSLIIGGMIVLELSVVIWPSLVEVKTEVLALPGIMLDEIEVDVMTVVTLEAREDVSIELGLEVEAVGSRMITVSILEPY
jgi:hypothetical protein